MSLELLEQLETKIQSAVDTIALLQMEVEELKEKNDALVKEADELRNSRSSMTQTQNAVEERMRALLGKMESVE